MRETRPPQTGERALLALLLLGQFLVVLDVSVVNVALPSMQERACDLGATGLQWVINGYTIAYAGFLLLGGRLADVIGQRRAFLAGVALFVAGSLVGGLAGSSGVLVTGRVVQGLGAAVAVSRDADDPPRLVPGGPAAGAGDGLVDGHRRRGRRDRRPRRRRAHRVAVVALGAAGQRAGRARGPGGRGPPAPRPAVDRRPRLDVPGAATATAGLGALVLGITQIEHARLDRPADGRADRDRGRAACGVRRDPAARAGAAHAAVAPASAGPRGRERRHARLGRRPVRDLVLPHAVHAAGARLVAAPGRASGSCPTPWRSSRARRSRAGGCRRATRAS